MYSLFVWFAIIVIVLLTTFLVVVISLLNILKEKMQASTQVEKKLFMRVTKTEKSLLLVIREIERKGEIDFIHEISELAYSKARLQSSKLSSTNEDSDNGEEYERF